MEFFCFYGLLFSLWTPAEALQSPGRLAAPFNIGVKRGFMFVNQNLVNITLDGQAVEVTSGMTVLEAINLAGLSHPQICYVPEVDPIQTCDTCIVEIDGKLARACSTIAVSGMNVKLSSASAKAAQTEAMDRILENHLLYCTVCDNNNGNCKLHNTAEMMEIEHQKYRTGRRSNLRKSICPIRSTVMTRINALPADSVSRSAKIFR